MSRSARFETVVLEGHKGLAFELPFDPAERWGVAQERLRPGRRGWRVRVSMQRARFESFVVPRSKRFWVLVSDEMERSGRLRAGSRIDVAVAPMRDVPS